MYLLIKIWHQKQSIKKIRRFWIEKVSTNKIPWVSVDKNLNNFKVSIVY